MSDEKIDPTANVDVSVLRDPNRKAARIATETNQGNIEYKTISLLRGALIEALENKHWTALDETIGIIAYNMTGAEHWGDKIKADGLRQIVCEFLHQIKDPQVPVEIVGSIKNLAKGEVLAARDNADLQRLTNGDLTMEERSILQAINNAQSIQLIHSELVGIMGVKINRAGALGNLQDAGLLRTYWVHEALIFHTLTENGQQLIERLEASSEKANRTFTPSLS
jgi:hypothetical protein